ncbi:C163A protein, partial [Nothocercus julius]|nr:C163A protein [Nothocercus julius]
RCAGRVEVKHEGQWGSVCSYDYQWNVREASVVCRQLGCGTVARASPYIPFGAGAGQIWLHLFYCRGTETALQNCLHLGWGQHHCDHDTDVGVTCSGERSCENTGVQPLDYVALGGNTIRPRASPPSLPLQDEMGRRTGPCEGRVEVKLRGQWGTVADYTWPMEDAEVVCQHLGCG